MKRVLSSCLALAAIALIAPRSAIAASLIINDTNPNETITFLLNDFEGGFILDGTLVQQGLNNLVSVTVAEVNAAGAPITHTFSADWITGGLVPNSGVIAFPELGIPPAQGVSDILTFTYTAGPLGGHLTGSFVSDPATLLQLPPGATVVAGESFVFNNGNITANAVSDVDAVPEPASLLLLGTGLVGAGLRWRKRRTVA